MTMRYSGRDLYRGVVLLFLIAADFFARVTGRVKKYNVLKMEIGGELPEGEEDFLLHFLRRGEKDFTDLLALLRWAREDEKLQAVVVCIEDLQIGWARLQSLRRGIEALRDAGKKVWVLLIQGGLQAYYVATAADKIFVIPGGHLHITGIASEVIFVKGTLDKLGVEAQIAQVGRYKATGETFTREGMSEAHREMVEAVLDDLFGQVVEAVSQARGKEKAAVRALIDRGPFLAQEALAEGLVDGLRYADEMDDLLHQELGRCEVIEEEAYYTHRRREIRRRTLQKWGGVIGLLQVDGAIKMGESIPGPEGGRAVGVKSFRRALRALQADKEVRGIVVRIASPGGSSVASDLMWREVMMARRCKPVIISMGDLAASGAYYLSVGGDCLFAEEGTITGSIGVIAGKAVLHGLYRHLGINKEIVTRGKRAALYSDYLPLAPEEWQRIDFEAQEVYRDFVRKVAECRHLSEEAVDQNGQGRVWTGKQAWARGLVDRLGGLEEAVEEAKTRSGIPPQLHVAVESYPKPRRWWKVSVDLHIAPRGQLLRHWTGLASLVRERVLMLMPFHLRFF